MFSFGDFWKWLSQTSAPTHLEPKEHDMLLKLTRVSLGDQQFLKPLEVLISSSVVKYIEKVAAPQAAPGAPGAIPESSILHFTDGTTWPIRETLAQISSQM